MSDTNTQNLPKETLSLSSTPLEVTNFVRGIKLSQFRKQLELAFRQDPFEYKVILAFLRAANKQPV